MPYHHIHLPQISHSNEEKCYVQEENVENNGENLSRKPLYIKINISDNNRKQPSPPLLPSPSPPPLSPPPPPPPLKLKPKPVIKPVYGPSVKKPQPKLHKPLPPVRKTKKHSKPTNIYINLDTENPMDFRIPSNNEEITEPNKQYKYEASPPGSPCIEEPPPRGSIKNYISVKVNNIPIEPDSQDQQLSNSIAGNYCKPSDENLYQINRKHSMHSSYKTDELGYNDIGYNLCHNKSRGDLDSNYYTTNKSQTDIYRHSSRRCSMRHVSYDDLYFDSNSEDESQSDCYCPSHEFQYELSENYRSCNQQFDRPFNSHHLKAHNHN